MEEIQTLTNGSLLITKVKTLIKLLFSSANMCFVYNDPQKSQQLEMIVEKDLEGTISYSTDLNSWEL